VYILKLCDYQSFNFHRQCYQVALPYVCFSLDMFLFPDPQNVYPIGFFKYVEMSIFLLLFLKTFACFNGIENAKKKSVCITTSFFLIEIRSKNIILSLYESKRKVSSAVELLNVSENFGTEILNNWNSI